VKRQWTLVALGVAAALVAVLIWLDQRRPSTEEATRQRQHILPGFERARATEIEIERPTPATKLRHEETGWWIVGPPRVRADDTAVDSLLAVLEYGEIERTIKNVDAKLREKLGLGVPRVILRVEGHTLRIGGDDPSRGVYVERDDDRDVYVAERRLIETAGIDRRLWLSMRLTIAAPDNAKQIATDAWTLENVGGWHVTKPARALASASKVDALVQSLDRTRATRDGFGGNPHVSLSLDGALQARLGGKCGGDETFGLAANRADGATLCFRDSDFNLVRAPVETYYERRLFPLRLDDLTDVDIGPLHLRRSEGAWRVVAPTARPADDAKVRAFLEPLLAAEAARFSPAPPAVSATRVRLATRDQEIVATVDGARARRAGETITLELAAPLALATSF
jgi:hypothetical protein